MATLLTVSDLRKLLGLPRHRIAYAIDRFGPEPAGRMGTTRFWNESDLPSIVESVDRAHANDQKFRPHRKAVAR